MHLILYRPLTRKLSLDAQSTHPFELRPGRHPQAAPSARITQPGKREWNAGRLGSAGAAGLGDTICAQSCAGARRARRMLSRQHTPAGALRGAPGRLPRRGRPPSLQAPEPSAALGRGREAAAPLPAGCARRRRRATGQSEPALLPSPLQTASPVPGPGATRARAVVRRAGRGRRVVTVAWSSGPARGLAPARAAPRDALWEPGEPGEPGEPRAPSRREEQPRRILLPPRPPRPPGLRARVTAERLLKGAAALGLRLPLRLQEAPTPGQSGRGPGPRGRQ